MKDTLIVPPLLLLLYEDSLNLDVILRCESENIDQGRSYMDKNINISHYFFSRISQYNGYGGVILVYGFYSINLNYSMLYYCLANYGGAIYIYTLLTCISK